MVNCTSLWANIKLVNNLLITKIFLLFLCLKFLRSIIRKLRYSPVKWRVVNVINLSSISDWEVYFSRHFGRNIDEEKATIMKCDLGNAQQNEFTMHSTGNHSSSKNLKRKWFSTELEHFFRSFHGYINFFALRRLSIPLRRKIQFAQEIKKLNFLPKMSVFQKLFISVKSFDVVEG